MGGGASGGGSINIFTVDEPPERANISANVNGGAGGSASGGAQNFRGRKWRSRNFFNRTNF